MITLRDVMAEFRLSGFSPAFPMGETIVDLRRELRETYDRLATAEHNSETNNRWLQEERRAHEATKTELGRWKDGAKSYDDLLRRETETLAGRLAEAERELANERRCSTCFGTPHASGVTCVCGGTGSREVETRALRLAAMQANDKLDTAERERDEAQRDAVAETIRRETAECERDEAIAACQQKHGVHPSWVNAVEKMRKERDEALEKLAAAVEALDSAHNALDQATYRSVVGADVGAEALNAVREALARIRGDK